MKARLLPWAPLELLEALCKTCFGHVMSKTCQYATIEDEKVCLDTKDMSLKKAQSSL